MEATTPSARRAHAVHRRGTAARAVAVVAVAVLVVLGACSSPDTSTARRAPRPAAEPSGSRARPSSPPTTTSTTTTTEPAPTTAAPLAGLPAGADATVTRVVDGDTIEVALGGRVEKVRLIGIDTPETKDPRSPVECFGREAAAQTASLLPPDTPVRLEPDVEARDRYGRLLAYVYRIADGRFVNAELVGGGWAAPYPYPPNVRYADRFAVLGREAREAGRGLWSACGGVDTPAGSPAPTASAGGATGCDPNYAGACVPISATDLDCADVGVRGFRVVGSDPHRFDGDGDGIACE